MSISPVDKTFGALAFVGTLIVVAIVAVIVVLVVDPPTASVKAQQGEPGFVFGEPDVTFDLTAEVLQWDVVAGEEPIEAWGYNGQYPGPTLTVTEGQKVRVNVTNNLPEDTTIHWHGLDVPNDQDGVPGITQPTIQPGDSWTYEFTANKVGTTVYHTHAHTVTQLAKGLFGFLIVEPKDGLAYDREYTLALHEISGFYTINGHSFPNTLDDSKLLIKEGETVLVRFANMGSVHHPMHLHGHEFIITSIDGNTMPDNWRQNTVDIPPGQTVDVVIEGDNPGTWTFHCHVVPHVTNRGVYPGGMLTLLDYEDDESYFDQQQSASE